MATLTYGCVKGYRMAAGSTGTVVCKEMGWTHTLVCEEIICPQVQPTNATITKGAVGPYRPGSIIRYRCQDGATLVGRSTLECRLDGQWSSDPPMCKEIICPPVKPTNATITEGAVGPYRPGSIIRYRCQDGQTLAGSSTLNCQSDGQWSSGPPVCKEIICPPVKPTNATITEGAVGPYRPGSIIRYRCQDEKTLAGSSTLNCQSDGQWSSGPPVCKVVTCPEPKKTNAVIVSRAGGPYTVNWVLKYECPDGTHRNGNDQIICQPDGHWSSEPPVCEEDSGSRKKLLSWLLPSLGLGLLGGGFLVWWFVFRKKKNRISS
ncbi:P-selectin-like isoform X2 [Engraulis encrasicolus]|uniref:P-selectin-like isoform X2 n=1 Tax=Engraulis encrasicolus TaxID=184585 RepID=UPI002FCF52A2